MNNRIILKGNTKLLKPAITQIMAIYQLLENLEIRGGNEEYLPLPDRRFRPQIRLHFLQNTDFKQTGTNPDTYQGRRRLTGQLTFRLMNETSESISRNELTRIGTAIKNSFGANDGYIWEKGKEMYCYADWDRGYQLQMLTKNTTQAKDLVTKILALQNHIPDWAFLNRNTSESESIRYPEIQQTKIILGETTKLRRNRPFGEVKFTYADAVIHGLTQPVTIFDSTYKKVHPLVTPITPPAP